MERIRRTLVHKGSILDIYEDEMQFQDGHCETWDFVSHRKGAAAVVAVDEKEQILLVHQYRNALERMTIELPAGCRDSETEDTKVCAMRELEEETGYSANQMIRLLSLKSTVAFCNELIDVYLAKDLTPGPQHLDPGEEIKMEWFSLYRRTQEEMPAIQSEYEEAVNEGVKFKWETSVSEFIAGLKGRRCEWCYFFFSSYYREHESGIGLRCKKCQKTIYLGKV